MPTTLLPQHRSNDLSDIQNRLESLWNELSGEIPNHSDDPKAQSLLQTGARSRGRPSDGVSHSPRALRKRWWLSRARSRGAAKTSGRAAA